MAPREKKPPALIEIPAGTELSQCSGPRCEKVIYWVTHPKTGRLNPVSIDDPRAQAPTETTPGWGVSHFTDCIDVDRYSGRMKKRPPTE